MSECRRDVFCIAGACAFREAAVGFSMTGEENARAEPEEGAQQGFLRLGARLRTLLCETGSLRSMRLQE